MTQTNNERDLILDDARAQSSISQNEQQDVVAWVVKIPESRRGCSNDIVFYYKMSEMLKEHILAGDDVTPLYASPPKREWVGLSDSDIKLLCNKHLKSVDSGWGSSYVRGGDNVAKAIEAKLKEVNGYD